MWPKYPIVILFEQMTFFLQITMCKFHSNILSILLYACEAWILCHRYIKLLEWF